MNITAKTQCYKLAAHILRKYGNVENQALTIIYEDLSNACADLVVDHMDTLKAWESWEAAWKAGELDHLPEWTNSGWSYP